MKRRHRGRIGRWRRAREQFEERMSSWLGVSAAEAIAMFDAGKLRGTLAGVEIECFRYLVEMEPPR